MRLSFLRSSLLPVASLALIWGGFAQYSYAGVIETGYIVEQETRAVRLDRVERLLASDTVARQMESLGVDKALVAERLQGLSDSELLLLDTEIDRQVAGGDALSLIGAVFLVLLILELVGVTDIFKII